MDGFDLGRTCSGQSFRGGEGEAGLSLGFLHPPQPERCAFLCLGGRAEGRACDGTLAPLHRPRNQIRDAARSAALTGSVRGAVLGAHVHLEPRNLLPRLPEPRVLSRPSSRTRGGYPRPSPGGGPCSALPARLLEDGQSWAEAAELGRWLIPPTCGCSSGHQQGGDAGGLQRPRRKGSGRACVGGRGLRVAEDVCRAGPPRRAS